MRIALVDDHQLFRKGMAALLEKMDDVDLVIEASNGREFLDMLASTPVEMVLLDLKMPVLDGRNTMAELKEAHPEVKILLLTMDTDEETILRCMEDGASGFLAKDAHPNEVMLAIRTIRDKGLYANERTTRIMMKGLSNWRSGVREAPIQLNDREMDILKYVCQQLTTAEIAEKMFLSPRTVEGYRRELLEKTDTKNSVGLVLYAAKQGWLDKWMEEIKDK